MKTKSVVILVRERLGALGASTFSGIKPSEGALLQCSGMFRGAGVGLPPWASGLEWGILLERRTMGTWLLLAGGLPKLNGLRPMGLEAWL